MVLTTAWILFQTSTESYKLKSPNDADVFCQFSALLLPLATRQYIYLLLTVNSTDG